MDKKQFVTIYGTYGNLSTVKQTLPSVIEETQSFGPNAKVIVHDSTELKHGRDEKWDYLKAYEESGDIFLLLSTNLSMAHARNLCLKLAYEQFCPEYIAMMEDDYGYKSGLILALIKSMEEYYGQIAPNGLRFGLFTASSFDDNIKEEKLQDTNHSYRPISQNSKVNRIGGTNSSFRCAPTRHWQNVLIGYDTDEYLISEFQTNGLNLRNYNKGFTVLNVGSNEYMFKINNTGRGSSIGTKTRMYDPLYTASDYRSHFLGKLTSDEIISENNSLKNKLKTLKRKIIDSSSPS